MADDCARGVLLWLEAKRNIGAAQLVLNPAKLIQVKSHNDKDKIKKIRICVRPQTVVVRRVDTSRDTSSSTGTGTEVNIPLPGEITVVPQSCQALRVAGKNELHMRLSLRSDSPHVHHASGWPLDGSALNAELKILKQAKPCRLFCRSCRNQIVMLHKGFTRVLQLPSDNWQQMAMNWYCHSHDHTSAAMATVGQQEMDCLVGSDYLVVHPSTVNNDSIHLVQGQSCVGVKCRRCRRSLGTISGSSVAMVTDLEGVCSDRAEAAVNLYKHTICTDAGRPKCNLFRNYSGESYIARKLLAQAEGGAAFKLLIQGQDSNKTHALLWLMPSTAVNIVTNCPPWNSNRCRESLDVRHPGCFLPSSKEPPNDILKMLYQVRSCRKENDTLFRAWRENSAVRVVRFPEDTCLELVLLLSSSTYTLPPTLRNMNGFQVGFLCKS